MIDAVAERARKIGGTTIRSVGDIVRHQSIADNNADCVSPRDILAELCVGNQQLTKQMRQGLRQAWRRRDREPSRKPDR
jgi:starvation-inducible DNA-binding protein